MNGKQKKEYRARAHKLKPVVLLGQNGLTENVMAEIENALDIHELIKVKLSGDQDDKKKMTDKICSTTTAELIQKIGHMIVLYRKNPERNNKVVN